MLLTLLSACSLANRLDEAYCDAQMRCASELGMTADAASQCEGFPTGNAGSVCVPNRANAEACIRVLTDGTCDQWAMDPSCQAAIECTNPVVTEPDPQVPCAAACEQYQVAYDACVTDYSQAVDPDMSGSLLGSAFCDTQGYTGMCDASVAAWFECQAAVYSDADCGDQGGYASIDTSVCTL